MTQGRSLTLALVALDALVVFLVFNLVAWGRGVVHWSDPLLGPLILPVAMHVLAVYLVDGYGSRTDVMSVTYASLHAIALLGVALLTLLLTFVFIPAGFPLQSSRFVLTVSSLLVIPLTLTYRRSFYQRRQARRKQRYFMFLGSPANCLAFKEECERNRMTQSILYATYDTLVH
ncbi:MAG TPA: polyprenyl glycosylphosphotransferase, partial [Lacunisphaera sp.]|nr:polyprenyl glycosylphosphotransferase [Lacunisphaera sp.]